MEQDAVTRVSLLIASYRICQHCIAMGDVRAVKLPWIFPGAPLKWHPGGGGGGGGGSVSGGGGDRVYFLKSLNLHRKWSRQETQQET